MTKEHATLKEYAVHRGVDPSYITRLKQQGRLVMVGKNVHVAGSDALLERESGDPRGGKQDFADESGSKADYMVVKTRETHWSAEQKRLKTLEQAGKLVEAAEVTRSAFERARLLRDAILNIPDRISASVAAESNPIAVHDLLTKELRNILNQLAGEDAQGD